MITDFYTLRSELFTGKIRFRVILFVTAFLKGYSLNLIFSAVLKLPYHLYSVT